MSPLAPDVLDFIARHLESAAELDVLLLLRRSTETFWAAAAVADRLSVRPETATAILERLQRHGLLARASGTSAFRFAPRNPADLQIVDSISAVCAQARPVVLAAIRSGGGARSQTDDHDVRA